MKAKTARRFLNRKAWKLAQMKAQHGRTLVIRSIRPYLHALRKDIRKNEASRKVYIKFSNMF